MTIRSDGISHITLRVADLDRTLKFYEGILGFQIERHPDRLRLHARDTTIIFRSVLAGTPEGDRFSEFRVGLDHLAFAVASREELELALSVLMSAGIATQGIQRFEDSADPSSSRDFVCFRDPDNIQLEFYMRTSL